MKKLTKKKAFLEELKRIPIVQVAAEKTNISRNSIYRWRKEDEKFSKAMDTALAEGEDLINDMTESQLLSLIKERNWPAISFWLRHRNPRFRERIEVKAEIEDYRGPMTPEQKEVISKAFKVIGMDHHNQSSENNE